MYIFGASGHGKVIADIIMAMGEKIDAVYDKDINKKNMMGIAVRHTYDGGEPLIIAIGNNQTRRRIAEETAAAYATAIHPSAIISPSARIGCGTAVMQGAIIQVESIIGKHCIINTGASIDHECMIGDYVHISPHATLCGNVVVGEGTWIGAGATIIQGIKIGRWSMIGAGAVVTNDIPDGVLAVGCPTRIVRKINNEMTSR